MRIIEVTKADFAKYGRKVSIAANKILSAEPHPVAEPATGKRTDGTGIILGREWIEVQEPYAEVLRLWKGGDAQASPR